MRFWLMLLLWTYHLVASASSRTVIYFDPSKIDDETSLLRIDWSQLAETALQLQSSRGEFGSTTPPTASLQTVPYWEWRCKFSRKP